MRERTPEEIREQAKMARELDSNPVFQGILTTLTAEAIQSLMNAPIGDLTAQAAHATMKSLNDIKLRLKTLQNDELMLNKRQGAGNG